MNAHSIPLYLAEKDVPALLDAAQAAFDKRTNSLVSFFQFKDRSYRVRMTQFRLLVDDNEFKPVACRWL